MQIQAMMTIEVIGRDSELCLMILLVGPQMKPPMSPHNIPQRDLQVHY